MNPRLLRAPRFLLPCVLLVSGCRQHVTHEAPPPIDGVRFVARARLLGPADSLLEIRVRAVNMGRAIRTLEFGSCSMNVGVASVEETPARTWEYVVWPESPRQRRSCERYEAIRDLAPGDSVSPADYVRRVPVRAILGDSLPPGRYRITARVAANGRSSDDLVVGEVELRPPASRSTAADGADGVGSDAGPLP